MILQLPCPQNCGGYMAQHIGGYIAGAIGSWEQRELYSADITDPGTVVVCKICGYEGPLPEQAKLMLSGAEGLPGM